MINFAALKSLQALVIVVAFAAWSVGVYRAGGAGPRAELKAVAQATAVQALHNFKNKERTDAENDRRTAALRRELDRLRREPPYVVPVAPPNSGCPATQVCFDTAEFERAYGDLIAEVRGVAAEGTQVTIDLDSARDWANAE